MHSSLTNEMKNLIDDVVSQVRHNRDRAKSLQFEKNNKYLIHIRMPPIFPPDLYYRSVLKGVDGSRQITSCPSIESIELHSSWQGKGFFTQLVSSLLEIEWIRYVVVANITNFRFNRALRHSPDWQILISFWDLDQLARLGYLIQHEDLTVAKLEKQAKEAFALGLNHADRLNTIIEDAKKNRLKKTLGQYNADTSLMPGIEGLMKFSDTLMNADLVFRNYYIAKSES